jgi:DNA-binding IclR family transcriptional regulator
MTWMTPTGQQVSPTVRDTEAPAGSLERAAALLDAFDETHRELTLAALVRRSGLPRSTVHRTAERMTRLGWLDKPADRYRIGTRIFEISGLVPVRHELREAVLPFMQDLYAATGTTVQLGVLHGAQVLVVEKITGHRAMPMLSQVGGVVPAHCSSLGRAILAYSGPEAVQVVIDAGLQPRTSRSVTSEVALRRELAAVPDRGWAAEREEGNIGVSCIAAPIFDQYGGVAAAVSITGPVGVVGPERMGAAVRLAAAAASRAYSRRI